jgi:hypothetical protein
MGGRFQVEPQVPFISFHGRQTMVAATKQVGLRESLLEGLAGGQQPLPPSDRDFEVFQWLALDGESSRATAEWFGISQTRVLQVRDRVAEWVAATVPASVRLSPARRVQLAARIAEMRLDNLYSRAVTAFRISQGEQRSTRTTPQGDTIVTAQESAGDIRYLAMAMQITDRTQALAVKAAEALGLRKDELGLGGWVSGDGGREGDASAEPRAEEARVQDSGFGVQDEQEVVNPPVGECSLDAAVAGNGHETCDSGSDTTDCQKETYSDFEDRRRAFLAALQDDTAPVQPPLTDGNRMLLEEPEGVSPNGHSSGNSALLGKPAVAPLNRKERRARQRMLERKLRKAK